MKKQFRTGDLKLIQELNRSIVLNTIRENGPISRSAIAKVNGISPTTVTSAINDLLQEGLVDEIGCGVSSGGRKPVLVKFSPNNHFLIAVSITATMVVVSHVNLGAEIVNKKTFLFRNLYGSDVVEFCMDSIHKFIHTLNRDKCIGISIIVPGIVDSSKGIVYFSSKLQLRNVPLTTLVEERFQLKTWIENDTNSIVLAEKKIGKYNAYHNLVYITIGDGVGAGIVYNDSILRGAGGGAGEFGHISISREGSRCDCGNVGCLENYVSWPTVYSRIVSAVTRGKKTVILELANGEVAAISPEVFLAALKLDDPLAKDLIEEVANYLSIGIVNLVNLFNPDLIILGGEMAFGNELLLTKVKAYVNRHAMETLSKDLEICLTSLSEDAALKGAACVLLQDVFRFPLHT